MSTDAEQKLWRHLRERLAMQGTHFRRQAQIGPLVVDFVCHGRKLIIELDGGQHAVQSARDQTRTQHLGAQGYRVIRFWNHEVLTNIDGVLSAIANAMTPTPDPSPQGGGEPHVLS